MSAVLVALVTVSILWSQVVADAAQVAALEEHEVNYSASDSMKTLKGVLRGEGILFDETSSHELVTLWSKADESPTFFQSLLGQEPRYRYRITLLPEGQNRTRLRVELETEHLPPADAERYKASTRLNLFKKFDELAAQFPPTPSTPKSGGVIFSLLPNEDLKAFAKRTTGNEANWRQIAQDNGIASPADVKPFQTLWVRNSLLSSPTSK